MSIEFKKVDRIIPPPPAGTETDVFYNVQSNFSGYTYKNDFISWSGVRDATTGNGTSTNIHYSSAEYDLGTTPPRWNVDRSFIDIDLSGVHQDAVITSGTLRCHMWDYQTAPPTGGAYVNLQQGTHGTGKGFTVSDYDAFTGPSFGIGTFYDNYRPYYIELNQDGLDYLNANIGTTVKFCVRENTHDYNNSAPDGSETFASARFYTYSPPSEDGYIHQEYKPLLTLKYDIPWEYTPPAITSDSVYLYALGGPAATNYNHDLRIARMFNESPTWSETRSATTASGVTYGDSSFMLVEAEIESPTGDTFSIFRSFMSFDLAGVTSPHDITGATLRFYSAGYGSPSGIPKMDVFKGTFDYKISDDDFDSFTGTSLVTAPASWVTSGNYVTFTLNSDGINYLKENVGKIISFCLREYDHDVQDSAPVNPGDLFACYFYGTGQGDEATYDPRLEIIYDTAS